MPSQQEAEPLNRDDPLPLWAQLYRDLRRRIDAGAFGERFPREHELIGQYGVSRHTVRDAVGRLRADGLVDSGRGLGTWLRPTIEQPLGALYSLFRSVEANGLEQRSQVRVLEVRVDPIVAAQLEHPPETELVYLERVRLADGEPLALDRTWLPKSLAEPLLDADFTHCGLYDQLAALTGTRLSGGTEVITAIVPDRAMRTLLELPIGCAAMAVTRLGCLYGRPVEWRKTVIRGDRFSVTAQWSSKDGYQMNVSSRPDA
jgi:GntR family transcriptional regulator